VVRPSTIENDLDAVVGGVRTAGLDVQVEIHGEPMPRLDGLEATRRILAAEGGARY
jgi:hypothetical protein